MTAERHRVLSTDTPGMARCHDLVNINGPSVIRRPDRVDLPGRALLYFLYVAHHFGTHIRLATADEITGPWTVVDGAVLDDAATPADGLIPRVASPDVHVLDDGEGAPLDVTASYPGPTLEPQHALRDPFVFRDDGSASLFSSGAGELAMGVTRLP